MSLVELAIGRYPIPIPSDREVASLFEMDPTGLTPRMEGRSSSQSLAIFELLEYIVNQVIFLSRGKEKYFVSMF